MNIAEDFSTLGLYNGLPYCPVKTTVIDQFTELEFDKWTTLSGYNKDDTAPPTEEQIRKSFELGTKLYYNYLGFKVEAFSQFRILTDDANDIRTAILNKETDFIIDGEDSSKDLSKPKDRICSIPSILIRETSQPASIFLHSTPARMARMYRDDVNDESGFLGYGLDDAFLRLYAGSVFGFASAELELSSKGSIADINDPTTPDPRRECSYIQIEDLHFVSAIAGDLTLQGSNASELKAADFIDFSNSDDIRDTTANVEVSDFKFWSYA